VTTQLQLVNIIIIILVHILGGAISTVGQRFQYCFGTRHSDIRQMSGMIIVVISVNIDE